jgi:hypothetical protein
MNRCESKILAKLQIVEEILNIPENFYDNRVDVLGFQARMVKYFLSDVLTNGQNFMWKALVSCKIGKIGKIFHNLIR